VKQLLRLVVRASRDSCGSPMECIFDPRYAFRVHDADPPLDILISFDCSAWHMQREMKHLPHSVWTDCIRDSLVQLITAVFGDSVERR
jgi:hypothetical protein